MLEMSVQDIYWSILKPLFIFKIILLITLKYCRDIIFIEFSSKTVWFFRFIHVLFVPTRLIVDFDSIQVVSL